MATATAELSAVRIPAEIEFEGEDFLVDEALESAFWDVVRTYERLRVITDNSISVKVVWKKKGGKSTGKLTYAKTAKASGLIKFFGEADVVIWLAADHLADAEYTPSQIRKLLYHEARHINYQEPDPDKEDDVGKVVLAGHDLEIFRGEIEDTGHWEDFRKLIGAEFRQTPLFETGALAAGEER